MSKLRFVAIFIGLLATIARPQDLQLPDGAGGFNTFFDAVEGKAHPHIYATVIYGKPNITSLPISSIYEFTKTIPQGIFDPTENIYSAAAILHLDFNDEFLNDKEQVVFYVEEITINAARTSFSVQVSFLLDELSGGEISLYEEIGLSVLLIGSGFSGSSDTVESSYVYAKMSALENTIYFPTNGDINIAQFNFKMTPSDSSPFDYLATAETGSGCGAIRKNGKMIIETGGCESNNFFAFITGFVNGITNPPGTQTIQSIAYITPGPTDQFASDPSTNPELEDPQEQGYIFKKSASDQSVGLWINYAQNADQINVKYVQISFVYVGIRDYTSITSDINPYPSQAQLLRDTFTFIAAANEVSNGISIFSLVNEQQLWSGPQQIQLNEYIDQSCSFGHGFCGFYFLQAEDDREPILEPFDPFSDAQVAISSTLPNAGIYCIFFSNREECTVQLQIITIDDFSNDVKTTGNIQQATNGELTSKSIPLIDATPIYKFKAVHDDDEIGQGSVELKYPDPQASEYLLEIRFASGETRDADTSETVKITVQGQIYFDGDLIGEESTPADDFFDFNLFVHSNGQPLTVLIEYSVPEDTSPSNIEFTFIQIALKQITNILNPQTFACLDGCPDKEGFQVGVGKETETFVCRYCDSALNQVYNPQTGSCECTGHYTQNITIIDSLVCIPCPDEPLCLVCDPIDFECSQCVADATLSAKSCSCNEGFYRNGMECRKCPSGCQKCINENICTSCEDNINENGVKTRGDASKGCKCLDGFYEAGEKICPPCHSVCLTCEESATKCTLCDEDGNFELDGTTCVCSPGFYLFETESQSTCEPCNSKCKECEISPHYCTICSENDFRELTGTSEQGKFTCQCKEGYVEYMGQCLDSDCDNSVPFCQNCILDTQLRTTQCLNCVGNRIVVNGFCECKIGYYQDGDSCKKCGEGCQFCQSPTSCDSCAIDAQPTGNGSCQCKTGFYIEESAGTFYCRNCKRGCKSCDSDQKCISCQFGFTLNSQHKCVCPQGYYLNFNSHTCVPCMSNCKICEQANQCSQCANNFIWDAQNNICSINCPQGTFDAGSQCSQCPSECTDCINNFICIGCVSGYNFFAGSCRQKCPVGTFALNGQCLACSSQCQQCQGGPSNCKNCPSGKIYFQGDCVSDCPDGTYYGDKSCLACSSRCLTCQGHTDKCTSCLPGQFLYDNKCFNQCPVVVIDGLCTDYCPDGTYISNRNCTVCDQSCQTCVGSADNCTSCSNGFFSHQGKCLENCPHGTFPRGGSCIPCDNSCDGCINTFFQCKQCALGYVKKGQSCFKECGQGFYIGRQNQCQPCGTGCRQCINQNTCSSCINPKLVPIGGSCQKACPPSAIIDQNGECACRFGYLTPNGCASNCPIGYYPSNRKCQPCIYPCLNCLSPIQCTSCPAGFDYISAERTCIRQSNCQYGQTQDQTRKCVQICQRGFFYKTFCLSECPIGLKNNGFGGCIEIPNFCYPPLFRQASSCVPSCSYGFFPNLKTRVCDQCPSNCRICFSKEQCTVCSDGYELNSLHQCIPVKNCSNGVFYDGNCFQVCPIGTILQGNLCERVCKQPLYFDSRNGFCYQTCWTPYHSPQACFERCPRNYQTIGSICYHLK